MSVRFNGESPDIKGEMQKLSVLESPTEIVDGLRCVFAQFGDLQGVSHLDGCLAGDVFLVDFTQENAALSAANTAGLRLFGFKTLIIDLRRYRAPRALD